MFPGPHKKIILVVIIVSLLAIIEFYLMNNDDKHDLLHRNFYYITKQPLNSSADKRLDHINNNNKQPNLPSEKHNKVQLMQPKEVSVKKEPVEKVNQGDRRGSSISQGDNKEQNFQAVTSNPAQQLVKYFNNKAMYKSYVMNLSSLQTESIFKQMGVNNLTLQKSRVRFLSCGGKPLLKQLNQPNSSVHIPSSFQHCKNMSFKSSGPTVALGSYPGSGNSWVRQLLESATGIYTGAAYCDMAYFEAGMIGENVDTNNVLVVKTHAPLFTRLKVNQLNYDKAIYIVRSPFGAILAEHIRSAAIRSKKLKGDSHTVEVSYNFGM